MKILMIAPEPFFEPRGTPISIYQRLQALSALRHEVDLLTYHVGQTVSIPGVVTHRSPRVPFIHRVKLGPSWTKAFLDILLFCQAIVLLAKNRYDVIHSHEEAAFWSVLLSKMFHTYHVYDMHSSLPQQLASKPRWNLWPFLKAFEVLEKWVVKTCDAIITIGIDLEQRVTAINPQAKVFLIQNLAVLADSGETSHRPAPELREKLGLGDKLAVVYTGTFEHYQGLDLLMNSAKIVHENQSDVSFVMVGGNPQQVEYWRNRARGFHLEDCVVFTGSVSLAEAIAYLDVAEILVSPRTEGTSVPLKIYSYLHASKPIVATDLPAHTQVLSGEMALLVAPTAEAFANAILALVQSPDLRRELGLRAQQFARERFNPADYLARVERVYQEFVPLAQPPEQTHSSQSRPANRPRRRRLRLC